MNELIISLFLLIPTVLFLITFFHLGPLRSIHFLNKWMNVGAILSIISGITGIGYTVISGATSSELFEYAQIGLTIRIDALSMILYTMIAIIGMVVIRYSKNYLDGEPRHTVFFSRLAVTIAFVQLLVISGNIGVLFIAWIGASLGLHRLLIFYPERKRAQLAARKKFIIARIGDATLFTAFILIYQYFGTGDLETIFAQSEVMSLTSVPFELELAGILLVISAGLKSVQIPFHGWLLDVMEAPTPVSALLHAGLLNAGPFLIIRFAYLIDLASTATIVLVIMGALSALYGAITASMQPTIKTALAYSSVGHMGFTLMVCGMGVYSASLLHLIAHSFYKAHAFLSSGSLIDRVQTQNALNYNRMNNSSRLLLGALSATALFAGITYLWELNTQLEFQMMVIAAIIFLGILSLQLNTIDSNNSFRSILYLTVGSVVIINFFYLFEKMISMYLGNTIPEVRNPNEILQIISLAILLVFSLTVLSHSVSSRLTETRLFRNMEVHFRNGLYINQYADRFMNSLSNK